MKIEKAASHGAIGRVPTPGRARAEHRAHATAARSSRLLLAVAATIAAGSLALAQPEPEATPQIWDIVLGTHVTRLPANFVATGCAEDVNALGRLPAFSDVEDCPLGDDGLRAIGFVQDDVDEYVARARRNVNLVAENTVNRIDGESVTFTLLVDTDGRVQGYRVETVEESYSEGPAAVATALRARFENWNCGDIRIGGSRCIVMSDDGVRWILTTMRTGDPPVVLEVLQLDPATAPAIGTEAATELPDNRPRPPYANRLAAFMAGASADCPGCNLTEFDLRRRDLSNGDLSGAILTGAILHGADLSNADLSGADLRGANLNRAIVAGTNFSGAILESAMLFAAEGAGANFTGAGLRSALIGDARLPAARFDGASLDGVDLSGATLTGASFFFATLRYASLAEADLTGADLRGTIASDAVLTGAILAQADATDAVMERADFRGADFTGANLTRAGLAEALLQGARLDGATLTDARLAGAIMPDGAIAP